MQVIVSESLRWSFVFIALVKGVVSVVEELLLVSGVLFAGELSENLTRAFVGVDFVDLPRGIFEVELTEFVLVNLLVAEIRAKNKEFLGAWYLYMQFLSFATDLEILW